ncbi:MAG TPA: hypothetical protein VFE47_20165 [Tepidisphaeraceae bacterium]|jgi:hypothetical protein|nr:hypothetical protein [Tepidisphaeraceae bacterium]
MAGRHIPEPLIVQFQEGYGIIAADVDHVTAIKSEEPGYQEYDCTFVVRAIPAQPIESQKAFPAHIGDKVVVRLDVGYAGGCMMGIITGCSPVKTKPLMPRCR